MSNEWTVPVDIASSIEELGIEIARIDGDEIYALCPGHEVNMGKVDNHASWSINAESGAHHCFSCGFSGNFVKLVKYLKPEISWEEARDYAKSRAGGIERVRQVLEGPKDRPSKVVDTSQQVNEASLALFTEPPAEALSGRMISASACSSYGVLWNPEKSSWILPVRDPETYKLWGWQEKSAISRYFNNYPEHTEFSKTLFGIDKRFERYMPVILVESPLDALRLWTVGYSNALSSFGTNVSDTQLELLVSRFWQHSLIIAMDDDPAGWEASRQLQQKLAGRITLRFLNYEGVLSDMKDVGEMSANEIHHALGNARSSVLVRF